MLRAGLRLLERHEAEETAKIAALRRAAHEGWEDLASGRHEDLADDDLDNFLGQLGIHGRAGTASELMAGYRLTQAAQADIVSILAWSHQQFGAEARQRYESLIATAVRGAAARSGDGGPTPRPELGDGVSSLHLARSLPRAPGGKVHRPRHLLIYRPTATHWSSAEYSTTRWIYSNMSILDRFGGTFDDPVEDRQPRRGGLAVSGCTGASGRALLPLVAD